jgi:hypothetical protein
MSESITINQALAMRKALIGRRDQLKSLVESSSTKKRSYYGENERTQEDPTFDVQAADAMKTQIDMALFKIDSTIKQSNASTRIEIPGFKFEDLMAPIKGR